MGNCCSSCKVKDETIQQLIHTARADQLAAKEATYALNLARAEIGALKGDMHAYLADIGRYGVGGCFEVAGAAMRSAIEHHPIMMAGSTFALVSLWHLCFRAHIERLKRATAMGQPLGELLEDERFADVNVQARDGPPIAAHACVLSTSPYFASLLQLQQLAADRRPSAEARLELRSDEGHADVKRYVEWLYLGVVNEQHAEQLFVLADRLTDARLQVACSQQLIAVRSDQSAWFQLVAVAGAAAAGVLLLASRVR